MQCTYIIHMGNGPGETSLFQSEGCVATQYQRPLGSHIKAANVNLTINILCNSL